MPAPIIGYRLASPCIGLETYQPTFGSAASPSRTLKDFQIFAPAAEWKRIRGEPRFIELMRLARAANSLALAWPFLAGDIGDESPNARRGRFAALFYTAALLTEGLRTAEALGKWYSDTTQYQEGFGALLSDAKLKSFQTTLLIRIRNEVVFHFDRQSMAAGLERLPDVDWVILSYAEDTGPTHGETYFDAADDAVLSYLFGDAVTDKEYVARLSDFMSEVTGFLDWFLTASHRLIAVGLIELGCAKRRVERPIASGEEEI